MKFKVFFTDVDGTVRVISANTQVTILPLERIVVLKWPSDAVVVARGMTVTVSTMQGLGPGKYVLLPVTTGIIPYVEDGAV